MILQPNQQMTTRRWKQGRRACLRTANARTQNIPGALNDLWVHSYLSIPFSICSKLRTNR